MKMKAVVCVLLLVLTLASRASTETDCTEVDPGSSADVCSMLQDKLQSALLQNPTNLDKLRKAFANPIPSIIDIHYDIEWGNVTAEACTDESTNFTHYSSNYLWTNVPFFTTLSPGFLQHLQLQVPYAMIRFAELFFGRVGDDYTLNALLWDGCNTELLLSLSLSLRVDSLPCTPSKQLLESSIQELTSWVRIIHTPLSFLLLQLAMFLLPPTPQLQAYADVYWPQPAFQLDVDKKQYAILHHPPSRLSEQSWIVITVINLMVLIIFYSIVGYLLHSVKPPFLKENKDLDEEQPYPLTAILVWNILVLVGELYAIITISVTCPIEFFSFSLKITLIVIPMVYLSTRIYKTLKEIHEEKECPTKKILTINFMVQGNLFLSIEYFTASVVPASLLAYTYPIQVIATIALLSTGLIFWVILTMFSRILYKQILKEYLKGQEKILKKKSKERTQQPEVDNSFLRWFMIVLFFVITIAIAILLMVALLSIFGIAILKGEANLSGPSGLVLSFLPAAVFSVLSWLMHKYKVKGIKAKLAEEEKDKANTVSALEEGHNTQENTNSDNEK